MSSLGPAWVKQFGELIVCQSTEYDWRWDDKGSGSKRDVTFWHPKGVNYLRPLGSVVVPGYWDINHKWPTLLIGPKAFGGNEPVKAPERWALIVSISRKGGQGLNVWKPIPPRGYVALGNVVTKTSNFPSEHEVWCVRQDLVVPATMEERATWDNWGSSRIQGIRVAWKVLPRFDVDHPRAEWRIPVPNHTFWFIDGSWNRPTDEVAWTLLLDIRPEIRLPRTPNLPPSPAELDKDLTVEEQVASEVWLPLMAVLDAEDERSRNKADYIVFTTYKTWTNPEVVENRSSQPLKQIRDIYKGDDGPKPFSSEVSIQILYFTLKFPTPFTFDLENGFKLKLSGVDFNKQLGFDVKKDIGDAKTGKYEVDVPANSWVVFWKQRFRIEARFGGEDRTGVGPVIETGIQPFWTVVASDPKRL